MLFLNYWNMTISIERSRPSGLRSFSMNLVFSMCLSGQFLSTEDGKTDVRHAALNLWPKQVVVHFSLL